MSYQCYKGYTPKDSALPSSPDRAAWLCRWSFILPRCEHGVCVVVCINCNVIRMEESSAIFVAITTKRNKRLHRLCRKVIAHCHALPAGSKRKRLSSGFDLLDHSLCSVCCSNISAGTPIAYARLVAFSDSRFFPLTTS